MKWSPSMIAKLDRIREVRTRHAELELARIDHALAICRKAEEEARQALAATTERSAAEAAQARALLLSRTAGGRRGISDWQAACKRAQMAVRMAHGKFDDAVSSRVGKELELSGARKRWRDMRFELERLRLLEERLMPQTPAHEQ
jgi:hypothetical protein